MSRNYIILALLVLVNVFVGVLCVAKYLEYREYKMANVKIIPATTSPLPPLSALARQEIKGLSLLREAYQASSTPIATSTIISQQKALDAARKKAAQKKSATPLKVQQQELSDLDALRAQAQSRIATSTRNN